MFDYQEREWQLAGECNKYDPELMFPDGEKSDKAREQILQAKAVCAVCPIKDKCLKWAEDEHEYFGIWGGETESERKEKRKITKPGMKRKVRSNAEGRITGEPVYNGTGTTLTIKVAKRNSASLRSARRTAKDRVS